MKAELEKLRDDVRICTEADRCLDARIYAACETYSKSTWLEADGASVQVYKCATRVNRISPPQYTSSIDAALALCERVLPSTARFGFVQQPDSTWRATVLWVEPDESECPEADGKNAPLALLDALLSALISKDTANG